MASLTYELNGRNGLTVSRSDIGLIIGKGASGLKRVISGAWTMYERLQDSDKRIDEEKPKLRIVLKEHDEGIMVEIISESETMRKLAQKSLDKSIEFMVKKRLHDSLKTEHFLVEFPERLLGKLIGKSGQNLKRLQNDIIFQDKEIHIHKDDVATAKTARIRVESLDAGPDEDGKSGIIIDKGAEPNTDFLGWGPSLGEDYEHYIKITISFKRDAKPFVDKKLYQERFSAMVMKRIEQIREEDSEQMDEINECLGFD